MEHISIKDWEETSRPREKLLNKGSKVLSDSELLAILIGHGTRKMSAVEVGSEILKQAEYNIAKLSRMTIDELTQVDGIGPAKAITIQAALELGRRRLEAGAITRDKITESRQGFEIMKPILSDLSHEEFWVVYLNKAHKIIFKEMLSKGSIGATFVDSKIILRTAINKLASAIILFHNHPSGNLTPSNSDKNITEKLKEQCQLFDIKILDHLILSENEYMSFADEGLM